MLCKSVVQWKGVNRQWLSSAYNSVTLQVMEAFSLYSDSDRDKCHS